MYSIWSDTKITDSYDYKKKSFKGNIKTDVLIIGGGIAGILCAYRLNKLGIPNILVDAYSICDGITKNTTAKITAQHGLIYRKLYDRYGIEHAGLYLDANISALKEYRKMCRNIDCDFEDINSYVYSLSNNNVLCKEMDILSRIGYPAVYTDDIPLPFKTCGAVSFPGQAQFNPMKFLKSLIPELKIYENTRVIRITDKGAETSYGIIKADNYIVTTHFPFINTHGSYFLKMYQHRSYVIAYENASNYNGMYIDESKHGLSFRNYKNLLLVGGGSHQTGKKGGGTKTITDFASHYYPEATEKHRFAAQDCMTLDSVPYIGRYSRRTHNLYTATGFNKWGMTSSMLTSMILSDMIMQRHNIYEDIVSPSRTIMHRQLITNSLNATINLLTPSAKRCPHLGCALKWNSEEKSWDCPCHGSRFTKNGKLIDNPAVKDI